MDIGQIPTRNARRYPKKEAIVDGDYRCTFLEFNNRVNRFSNSLLKLGLKKGDRVGILLRNYHEYIEILFSLAKRGLVAVPINSRLKEREVRYQLENSGSRVFIIGPEYIEIARKLKGDLSGIDLYITVRSFEDLMLNYEELVVSGDATDSDMYIDENDIISIMYTSGTTGLPKGAIWTHRNILDTIFNLIVAYKTDSEDKSLILAPLFHGAITVPMLHQFFFLGATVVLYHKESLDPETVLGLIEKEKITTTFMVPTMIEALLEHPFMGKYNLSSLKDIKYSGAPTAINTIKKAIGTFGKIFYHAYGLTEASGGVTFLKKEEHFLEGSEAQLKRLESAGKEYVNIHLRIIDDDGKDVPIGCVGEIIVKGDKITKGYWNLPKETQESLRGGWFFTGDLGRLDEEGYLFIVGRKKDMIRSGGENIYPAEIEEIVKTHPAVESVAVIGVPNKRWGEEVRAVVVLKKGTNATEEEIIELCKRNLASYKKPKSVYFAESLPINEMGKVQKNILKEIYVKED